MLCRLSGFPFTLLLSHGVAREIAIKHINNPGMYESITAAARAEGWLEHADKSALHKAHRQIRNASVAAAQKTVRLSGLDWEDQCIFSTQSEIGLFPTGEESLYIFLMPDLPDNTELTNVTEFVWI